MTHHFSDKAAINEIMINCQLKNNFILNITLLLYWFILIESSNNNSEKRNISPINLLSSKSIKVGHKIKWRMWKASMTQSFWCGFPNMSRLELISTFCSNLIGPMEFLLPKTIMNKYIDILLQIVTSKIIH